MNQPDAVRVATTALAGRCPEPILAAVLVHRSADGPGRLKRALRGSAGPKLRTNNYLILTPTQVRLFALGGRTGMKPKEDLGAWPLGTVRVSSTGYADRNAYFASTGSSYDYRVHRLHLEAPGLDLLLDVMADAGLSELDRDLLALGSEADNPDMAEAIAGLKEMDGEVTAMVTAIVSGTGGAFTP